MMELYEFGLAVATLFVLSIIALMNDVSAVKVIASIAVLGYTVILYYDAEELAKKP
jgi:multisubunit Na+/H+ antiporter MnhC subunit